MNNRDRNFTKNKITFLLAHLETDVERYINKIVRIDSQEEGEARTEKGRPSRPSLWPYPAGNHVAEGNGKGLGRCMRYFELQDTGGDENRRPSSFAWGFFQKIF